MVVAFTVPLLEVILHCMIYLIVCRRFFQTYQADNFQLKRLLLCDKFLILLTCRRKLKLPQSLFSNQR